MMDGGHYSTVKLLKEKTNQPLKKWKEKTIVGNIPIRYGNPKHGETVSLI